MRDGFNANEMQIMVLFQNDRYIQDPQNIKNGIDKRDNKLWYNEWTEMKQEWLYMGIKRKYMELLEIKKIFVEVKNPSIPGIKSSLT